MSNTDSRWSTTADYPDYEFDYYIVLLLLLLLLLFYSIGFHPVAL